MSKDKSNKLPGPAPGEIITVQMKGDRAHKGQVQGVFDDAIVLLGPEGRFIILYRESIEGFWTEPTEPATEGNGVE